jgi:type I restriction-modification system DNA methylase subunit
MSVSNKIHELLGIKESYEAAEAMMRLIKSPAAERDPVFLRFLKLFNHDMNNDWFHNYYMEEQAERLEKKQDFTPMSVARLTARLTSELPPLSTYDGCAGTGGLTIAKWREDIRRIGILNYKPSCTFYQCDELSARALPFLLFNIMIRGMNAIVKHGDILEHRFESIYYVLNENDDALGFSGLLQIDIPCARKIATA